MADTTISVPGISVNERILAADDDTLLVGSAGSWKVLGWFGILLALIFFWRIYQQLFSWSHGLDSAAPDYATYFMRFMYFNTGGLILLGLAWMAWAVKDCKTCLAHEATFGRVLPRHEEKHIWMMWGITLSLALGLYGGASYFGESDGSWHQVAIRDTAFTPAHVIEFYSIFVAFLINGVVGYLYSRKHLRSIYPVSKGFPLSWGLVLMGVALLMYQVAFNEFGHSFWITEEIFSAPLHWGFTVFAFLEVALVAVWLESVPRVVSLQKEQQELLSAKT